MGGRMRTTISPPKALKTSAPAKTNPISRFKNITLSPLFLVAKPPLSDRRRDAPDSARAWPLANSKRATGRLRRHRQNLHPSAFVARRLEPQKCRQGPWARGQRAGAMAARPENLNRPEAGRVERRSRPRRRLHPHPAAMPFDGLLAECESKPVPGVLFSVQRLKPLVRVAHFECAPGCVGVVSLNVALHPRFHSTQVRPPGARPPS